MDRPHVVLVGGKDSGFRSISDLDVDVTLVQTRENLTALQLERAARVLLFDTLDSDTVESLAHALNKHHPVDGVLSFFEDCLLPASLVAESLGTRGNPVRPVQLTRDKLRMRAFLQGVPEVRTVQFASCLDVEDVRCFAATVNGPVILKPAAGAGSRGVALIEDGDVEAAWAWCAQVAAAPFIAEEYVEGAEVSVETLTVDGVHRVLGVTEKLTTGAPGFVETGHQFPARLPDDMLGKLHASVVAFLDAIGHEVGPAHSEFRLTDTGEAVLIESQTRFGGDQIWEMVELVTGIPIAGSAAASLLGIAAPAAAPCARSGAAAIRFFANEHCTVEAVEGVEAARSAPGVVRVDIRATPGQRLGPLTGSWSRQGYVLATGRDTDEAVANAEGARDLVRFVTS